MSLMLALLGGGCGTDCENPRSNDTGTYRSVFVYQFSGVEPKNAFPHKRGKTLQMTVYRDLQQVTFEYVRDGKSVEETWDCVDRVIFDPNLKPGASSTAAADGTAGASDSAGPDSGDPGGG